MKKILLVGAGQIGSRYLQGLAKVEQRLEIIVVDPLEESLSTAEKRWCEADGEKTNHIISWENTFNNVSNNVDLSIISTPSKDRQTIINRVHNKANPDYWIIEKVLCQSASDLDIIKSSIKSSKGAWINTPRRLMKWHNNLKNKVSGFGPIKAIKTGKEWGLACNSIHFIDLISWWTGEALISIDGSKLNNYWTESKRTGYFETTGELLARYSGGSELTLQSDPNSSQDNIILIMSNNKSWTIDELKGTAIASDGTDLNGRLEHQSELTAGLISEILAYGNCNLPSFQDSYAQHAFFLSTMLAHWNTSQSRSDKRLPIT